LSPRGLTFLLWQTLLAGLWRDPRGRTKAVALGTSDIQLLF
jgi:hypothetical protein